MRSTTIALAISLGLLLAGCTTTTSGSPAPTTDTSALATALSRVPAAALGSDGHFEFGSTARLRELAAADASLWGPQVYTGAGALSSYSAVTEATIGVDLSTATSALTVGQPPRSMIVITGGQVESKVTAAATKSGWTAGTVLSRDLNLSQGTSAVAGISIVAPKIKPIGQDVVLSGAQGDPSGVAATGTAASSPADQLPAMKAAIGCLGNVSLALGTGIQSADPAMMTVVGSGAGSGSSPSSVICLGATDAAAAHSLADKVRASLDTGRSQRSGRPWKELLMSPKVDVVDGSLIMVRITAQTAAPGAVIQMVSARDLPGR